MIALLDICEALPRMTGDAAKVALLIATVEASELRADAEWIRDAATAAGVGVAVVRATLRELKDLGLVSLSGRNRLTRDVDPTQKRSTPRPNRSIDDEEEVSSLPLRVEAPPPAPDDTARSAALFSSSDTPTASRPAERRDTSEQHSLEASGSDVSRAADATHGLEAVVEASFGAARPLGVRDVIDTFHRVFVRMYSATPTWDGRNVTLLKQLVAKHGAEEVIRRIGVMFDDPPSWFSGPFDVNTLRFHFDKFASGGSRHTKRGSVVDKAPADARTYYGQPNVPGFENWNDLDGFGEGDRR